MAEYDYRQKIRAARESLVITPLTAKSLLHIMDQPHWKDQTYARIIVTDASLCTDGKPTAGMSVIIVDPEHERITILQRRMDNAKQTINDYELIAVQAGIKEAHAGGKPILAVLDNFNARDQLDHPNVTCAHPKKFMRVDPHSPYRVLHDCTHNFSKNIARRGVADATIPIDKAELLPIAQQYGIQPGL